MLPEGKTVLPEDGAMFRTDGTRGSRGPAVLTAGVGALEADAGAAPGVLPPPRSDGWPSVRLGIGFKKACLSSPGRGKGEPADGFF